MIFRIRYNVRETKIGHLSGIVYLLTYQVYTTIGMESTDSSSSLSRELISYFSNT